MQQDFALGVSGSEQKLSAHDCELSMSAEQFCLEGHTAQGVLRRKVLAVKRTWHFHWSFLPARMYLTLDGGLGRDELDNLCGLLVDVPGQELSLLVPGDDRPAERVAVQFVSGSWQEKLVLRDPALGLVYDLSLALAEV